MSCFFVFHLKLINKRRCERCADSLVELPCLDVLRGSRSKNWVARNDFSSDDVSIYYGDPNPHCAANSCGLGHTGVRGQVAVDKKRAACGVVPLARNKWCSNKYCY